jgi:hypothetical protein
MNGSPGEAWVRDLGEKLLATAPTPVVLEKQRRYGPNHLRLGHMLRAQELHCSLRGGKLRILYRKPWKIRHMQLANLISEAVAVLGQSLPPFYVNTGDRPGDTTARPYTVFGNCSVDGQADVAAPDFVFNGWPEAKFADFDAEAAKLADASLATPVHQRAFWTGRVDLPAREALVELSRVRPKVIEAVDSSANYDREKQVYVGRFVTMAEQIAQYRYMIDVEGDGYSGRLKLLLHARRAVLMLDRPYREYFFEDLEPFRHFVPVARYSSNLVERIEWLRANPAREKEIISEAQQFARTRLTRRAAVEYWAALLEKHAQAGGNLHPGDANRPMPGTSGP